MSSMKEPFIGENEGNQFNRRKFEAIVEVAPNLFVEYFPAGAEIAAKRKGINVIIDTFRASNTILALLKYVDHLIPVSGVEEALSSQAEIIIGEVGGRKPEGFHLTNSPVEVEEWGSKLRGKRVVLRTTNGTQGLLRSKGAREVLIASPRNAKAVSDYLRRKREEGLAVNLIALGTKTETGHIHVPEDDITAKMLSDRILGKDDPITSQDLFVRVFRDPEYYQKKSAMIGKDIGYCLSIDATDMIPIFDEEKGIVFSLRGNLGKEGSDQ
ncbi:MAG: hypothetical protein D6732_20895 [Methanobacteriota archaeon]|nr:MAG: hypothetical protein D6732_20895 [Euryarchaeota archaeon]